MWYNKVVANLEDLPLAIAYYDNELTDTIKETKIQGNLERNAQELSGIMAWRFNQLQEIEAILKHLNIKYDKIRSDLYRRYLEKYQRDLNDRAIEKYIDGEDDVVGMSVLINEVSLIRNKYLALIKGLEIKNWQISNIIKLRVTGLESATLENNTR